MARVGGFSLSLLSDDQKRGQSVVKVTDPSLYVRGMPNENGLQDTKMGSVDRRLPCSTCGKPMQHCTGHFGIIELEQPCFDAGSLAWTMKMLRSLCFFCHRAACDPTDGTGRVAFARAYNSVRARKRCAYCKRVLPTYAKAGSGIRLEWPSNAVFEDPEEEERCRAPFTASDAYRILNGASDSDYIAMGLNPSESHPRDLILHTLLVPPPCVRPAVMVTDGSRSKGHDDVTYRLIELLKRNKEAGEATPFSEDAEERMMRLQLELNNYLVHSKKTKGGARALGRTFKTIVDRFKGKEGRIRSNLMGKRCDQTARTVISPDPDIDLDEVGVPTSIALVLTVPQLVTYHSIETLRKCVSIGPKEIGGAERIDRTDGGTLYLLPSMPPPALQMGMVVHRYLQDGDLVVFNRQPSLHKMSLMAHRVRILGGNSFRLNPSCTSPYNADFDGDEMNLHVLQHATSTVEARGIMKVEKNIVSPQSNRPVISLVQDALLGTFLMTRACTVGRAEFMNLAGETQSGLDQLPPPAFSHGLLKRWTGHQVLSLTLPRALTLVRPPSVVILKGQLLLGVFGKLLLGRSAASVTNAVAHVCGPEAACRFLTDVQRVANRWLMHMGVNVGVRDCMLDEGVRAEVDALLDGGMAACDDIEGHAQVDDPEAEATTVRVLSQVLMAVGDVVHARAKSNTIFDIVDAGSKGNRINVAQISGCVGQQSVEGKRLHPVSGKRGASARGFVRNSYASGLSPLEFFGHAKGGREGLIDTAIKTAQTGYMQRRLVKACESVTVQFDCTVCSEEMLVSMVYGGDSFDAAMLESNCVAFLCHDRAAVFEHASPPGWGGVFAAEAGALWEAIEEVRECQRCIFTNNLPRQRLLPFSISRLLGAREFEGEDGVEAAPTHRIIDEELGCFSQNKTLRCLLLYHLCAANRRRLRLGQRACRHLLRQCRRCCERAVVSPGEAVGVLAAQSISEPLTQMTLNTFHYAGVAKKSVMVTQGIPRIREIVELSQSLKAPVCTVSLAGPLKRSRQFAEAIAAGFGCTSLRQIASATQTEPSPHEDDLAVAAIAAALYGPLPPFRLRVDLDMRAMKNRRLEPHHVRSALKKVKGVRCVTNESNSTCWSVWLHSDDELPSDIMQTRVAGKVSVTDASCREVRSPSGATEYLVDMQTDHFVSFACLPYVDWYDTTPNSIMLVYETLGIEAAANALFHELESLISHDGSYVDPRHVMLIVDTMTWTSQPLPLNRHGLREIAGPLHRLSFEEPVQTLYDASVFAETDTLNVSSCVMAGQLACVGTGMTEIIGMPAYDNKPLSSRSSVREKATRVDEETEIVCVRCVRRDLDTPPPSPLHLP